MSTKRKRWKMSVGFGKGKKNSMYGKHHTKETKKKQIETQLGEKGHQWKSSVFIKNNYWTIYLPHWPIKPKRIKTCRFIASMMLGRHLTKEAVHHIDEDKLNDKPENLYVFFSCGKHTGYHNKKIKPDLISNLSKVN